MFNKHFDIVVLDKEYLPVLVANVIKAHPFTKSRELFYYQRIHKYAKRIGVEYILIVTPSIMKLWSSSNGEVLAEFDTAAALNPYIGKEFKVGKVSKHYLRGSAISWLDDLIYPWKKPEAPYKKELEALGVLKKIREGYVEFEVKE